MPKFLLKNGKFAAKKGKLVAVEDPADCDCCGKPQPPECATDEDCDTGICPEGFTDVGNGCCEPGTTYNPDGNFCEQNNDPGIGTEPQAYLPGHCCDGVCQEEPCGECTTSEDCLEGEVCCDGVCQEGSCPCEEGVCKFGSDKGFGTGIPEWIESCIPACDECGDPYEACGDPGWDDEECITPCVGKKRQKDPHPNPARQDSPDENPFP